jgi:hypothetical protein
MKAKAEGNMPKRLIRRPRLDQTGHDRQLEGLLDRIREELPSESDGDYLVIHLESEEYVTGKTPQEAMAAYDKRWPHRGFYACRVDGGPFMKMHRHTS